MMIQTQYLPTIQYQFEPVNGAISDAEWRIIRAPHPHDDEHRGGDRDRGRYGLWWRHPPDLAGERVGFIGQYQADDPAIAQPLLHHACEQLRQQECTIAIAPVDGSTWQRYRVAIAGTEEPPFFLEPDYPTTLVPQLDAAGFSPIAHYYSALNTDLTDIDSRSPRVHAKFQQLGVTIRSLNLANLDVELANIYPLICTSFQHNFLYHPLSKEHFIQQYQALLPYIQPELVLLAEHHDRLVGLLFCVPNWLEVQRGEPLKTIILKTVAVHPDRTYAGLGQLLFEQCHAIAQTRGFVRAIYALIHAHNPCWNLVRRYAQPCRRYAVFAKSLT